MASKASVLTHIHIHTHTHTYIRTQAAVLTGANADEPSGVDKAAAKFEVAALESQCVVQYAAFVSDDLSVVLLFWF